jgi:hypothetical protein
VSKEEFDKAKLTHQRSIHETRAVLAEGEETGHYHAVYMDDILKDAKITLCKPNEYTRNNAGIIVKGTIELRHEEHDTIRIPEGYYLQQIVKEHDHITGRTRGVMD